MIDEGKILDIYMEKVELEIFRLRKQSAIYKDALVGICEASEDVWVIETADLALKAAEDLTQKENK